MKKIIYNVIFSVFILISFFLTSTHVRANSISSPVEDLDNEM